ncbi:MAG: ATP-dependent DNA helicase [Acidimicrobiia bacterium]|nr:ATP-dependent DNA helicase [Acidimicrobiia bacterium]
MAAVALLDEVVAAHGGEPRSSQRQLGGAIGDALTDGHHLFCEAPTGVGKTFAATSAALAWLAASDRSAQPIVDATVDAGPGDEFDDPRGDWDAGPGDEWDDGPSDTDDDGRPRRVVIATATLALQDQLVDDDLPHVAKVAAGGGTPLRVGVLKGRSNYLCLARADEQAGSLFEDDRALAESLVKAAAKRRDGQRASLPTTDDEAWRRLSVTSDECPGSAKCSRGGDCWAEWARREAERCRVLVVNQALYAAHLLSGEVVLPEHDAVIIDEAHALADTMVNAASVTVSPARLRAVERLAGRWASKDVAEALKTAADGLADALEGVDGVVDPASDDLAVHLAAAAKAAKAVASAAADEESDDEAARDAAQAAALAGDLALLATPDENRVSWTERDGPLRSAPVEPAPLLDDVLWPGKTVVAMSATLRNADAAGRPTFAGILTSTGAPADTRTLAVDSPFDFRTQAMLYVPKGRIPSPRQDGWLDGVADELWHLVDAAGGRTLALFTSRAATERVAEDLRRRIPDGSPLEVLTQWDGPRHLLVGALRRRRTVVLCATRSFWTGIDIPGDACVVVAIDRLPFPRPDDPLISARRQRATDRGERSFETVDLPMAALQLAQGAGRLIRSHDDRGVVAVLDTRLATSSWRRRLLGALPPLKRSIDPDEVAAFLRES